MDASASAPTHRPQEQVSENACQGGEVATAVCISGANVQRRYLGESDSGMVVVERPELPEAPQHLWRTGYDNPYGQGATVEAGCVPHIRRIGEEKKTSGGSHRPPLGE